MILIQYCKMQIVCLFILAYIGVKYIQDGRFLNRMASEMTCNRVFDVLYVYAELAVLFDGLTAVTVNFTDVVPHWLNLLLHFGMFFSYENFATHMFWYWVTATDGAPQNKGLTALASLPGVLAIVLTALFMPQLEFRPGIYTDYSMGAAVYVVFFTVVFYFVLMLVLAVKEFRSIPSRRRASLVATLICVFIIFTLEVVFHEFLGSSIAVTLITIGFYISMENPAIKELQHYHHEMVMGFANLVENRDDSTGGHIIRSSAYAVMIAEKLRSNKEYRSVLTRDYIDNLALSAPMHDVGKIGIPDYILQKPGKLTAEEYERMKEHSAIGARIIQDSFGNLRDSAYEDMAYEIARHHHEKWNGKGYPDGLSGKDIPLCARIMAVADVFDAVSAKRCYRDALSLDECYRIISEGSGSDFDPDLVKVFMDNKASVEEIYYAEIKKNSAGSK